MKRNQLLIAIFTITISLVMITNSISVAELKGSVMESKVTISDTIYSSNRYVESIEIYPLKDTAVGVNTGFVGGTVEFPFDISSYNDLEYLSLIAANQRLWKLFSQRRFWDIPDGVTLQLAFTNIGTEEFDDAVDDATEIKNMINTAYGFNLHLIIANYNGFTDRANFYYLD
ncbi:MAG: hypothetical protein ACFFDW_02270, partial [Candidatus Thorarchaeota archaeon]